MGVVGDPNGFESAGTSSNCRNKESAATMVCRSSRFNFLQNWRTGGEEWENGSCSKFFRVRTRTVNESSRMLSDCELADDMK